MTHESARGRDAERESDEVENPTSAYNLERRLHNTADA